MDGRELLEGPLVLEFVFFRPRPAAHFGRRGLRPSAPEFPTTRPDVLKLARAVKDALTGVVWRDDAQVVDERLAKRFEEPARVEVRVRRALEGARR
jgi:Holliday junction resolvase RusA-like endonuclease